MKVSVRSQHQATEYIHQHAGWSRHSLTTPAIDITARSNDYGDHRCIKHHVVNVGFTIGTTTIALDARKNRQLL